MPTLYDEDLALWAGEQGRLLRAAGRQRRNEPIDWDHVAEEIETLGNSQASEVRTRLVRIIEHLLKLQFSPAREPRLGWQTTISQQREELEAVLADSPSLRARLLELGEWAASRAARSAARELALYGEDAAAAAALMHGGRYSLAEMLEVWPPAP